MPDDEWQRDSPIEQEDGTLRCKRHYLEVCGKCCVDYTFMREVLGMDEDADEDEDKDWTTPTRSGTGPIAASAGNFKSCAVCGGSASKQCSKCKQVYYCCQEHQKLDWSKHRVRCQAAAAPISEKSTSTVLLVHFGGMHDILKEQQDSFKALIDDHFSIITAFDEPTAMHILSLGRPAAVVIMETLPPQEYSTLTKGLVSYANQGGTVILGFGYPNFTRMDHFDELFAQFGKKNWTRGGYHRDMFYRNDTPAGKQTKGAKPLTPVDELNRRAVNPLPQSYSMKALHVKGLARGEAVYLSEELRKPKRKESELEAPVAFTSIGRGWLGYLGDVNIEGMTELIAKAMVGLRIPRTDTEAHDIPDQDPF